MRSCARRTACLVTSVGLAGLGLAPLACRDFNGLEVPKDAASPDDFVAAEGDASCSGPHLRTRNGHCYRFEQQVELMWRPAESDCVTWGGHLIGVNDADEQTFVRAVIDDELGPDAGQRGVWIGLNDLDASRGDWKWTTGDPFQFANWGPGEPETAAGKDCVYVYGPMFQNNWSNFMCTVRANYLCER